MKKKFWLIVAALAATLCLCFGIAACGSSGFKTEGTYYLYENGSLDKSDFIKLDGGKWTDHNGDSGDYSVSGESITIYVDFFGEKEEFAHGTVKDGVMTLTIMGAEVIYCQEGCEPSGGSAGNNQGNTPKPDDGQGDNQGGGTTTPDDENGGNGEQKPDDENGGNNGGTHTHTFAEEWSADETEHWHAATCEHTSERKDVAEHTYKDGVCTVCGYEHENHAFEYTQKTEEEHTVTCSVCGKTETTEHTYKDGKCKDCGYEHKNHKYGADGSCEVCGAKKALYSMSEDGLTLTFGEYPQTEVKASDLKASLNMEAGSLPTSGNAGKWKDYGYYISGKVESYMWYIDVTYSGEKYRGVYFTSYRPNRTTDSSSTSSYQDESGYNIKTAYWFQYEPIEWRILEEKNGTALLMANLILDSQQYYHSTSSRTESGKTVYANNYAESDIRAWLNKTFYETAFDEYAEGIIETTTVDNSPASTASSSNQYACENTQDKVFLLSYQEVGKSEYGLASDSSTDKARQLKSTDYAKSQGVYVPSERKYAGNSMWWLRSPRNDGYDYDADCVDYAGSAYNKSFFVNYIFGGVVPALRIRL